VRRSGGQLRETPVELNEIMTAKSPDITLEDEGVWFLPKSASESSVCKNLDSIV